MHIHTCRCYYGNMSINKRVNMSIYLYIRRFIQICVDLCDYVYLLLLCSQLFPWSSSFWVKFCACDRF